MSYEDFIEGIKPTLGDEIDERGLSYEIKEGLFKQICTRARNYPNTDFAMLIDEINRGNVAGIFGELISLIEEDKREGALNELKALLPYSRKLFSVPRNLYVIGTMNSADRSVEALDTALRRRFAFVEMVPEPERLGPVDGIDVSRLLSTINLRLEALRDRDHRIGHAYFMGAGNLEELRTVFKNKVIPLLQEYFYGDWSKIALILGTNFVVKSALAAAWPKGLEEDGQDAAKERWIITDSTTWDVKAFESIYA
jgi:5-methylcytosine-specific restriction protein B